MYPEHNAPEVPFICAVPDGVRIGTQVIIEGEVPSFFAKQFQVNLVCGHNPSHQHVKHADIALHINPRMDEKNTVLNTRSYDQWDWTQEQRVTHFMPFRSGKEFELVIAIEAAYYRISVNGSHFANFPDRMPFTDVGVVYIDGRVSLSRVRFMQPAGFSPSYPTAAPAYNPSYAPGAVYEVAGRPKTSSSSSMGTALAAGAAAAMIGMAASSAMGGSRTTVTSSSSGVPMGATPVGFSGGVTDSSGVSYSSSSAGVPMGARPYNPYQ